MKRTSLFLCLAAAMAIAACGTDDSTTDTSAAGQAGEAGSAGGAGSSGQGGAGVGGAAGGAAGAGHAGVGGAAGAGHAGAGGAAGSAGSANGGNAGSAGSAGNAGTGGSTSGSRATQWVHNNPMFISGLTVSMAPPPVAAVNQYFDTFHANAVHLWQDGMGPHIQGWADAGHAGFRFVSWLRPDGTSTTNKQVVGGKPAMAGRIGYQIGDEPCQMEKYKAGDNCDTKQGMKDLQVGIDAVRKSDPKALVIVNFGNVASGDAELDQIITYYAEKIKGDILSYDQYSMNYSAYDGLERYRRVGLKYGMPYWRYINSYDNKNQHNYPTETDMRWEAFIGLLYGFTGHTWFIYQISDAHALSPSFFDQVGSWSSTATKRFAQAASINQRMAVFGRTITQLTSTDVRFIPAVGAYMPKSTKKWAAGAGGDTYITGIAATNSNLASPHDLAVGFFNDATGKEYVMLQHVNHKSASYPSNGTKDANVQVKFDFSSAPANLAHDHLQILNSVTGQVANVPLQTTSTTSSTLALPLAAGDAILFAYDTGATFVQQP